ncbi:MAG: hypothetical protein WBX15_03985 [Thermoanaerobaculia bacterium]
MNIRLNSPLIRTLTLVTFALTVGATARAEAPYFSKAFSPQVIGPGSVSTLTFTISTAGEDFPAPADDLAFTDALPAGMTLAAPAMAGTDCAGGAVSAPDGGSTIGFSGGRLGVGLQCHVWANVTASTAGTYTNVSASLTSDQGDSGTAAADLTVSSSLPRFTKDFSPSTVTLNHASTLTFTIDDSAIPAFVVSLGFTDNLPAGLQVASPANVVNTCGGAVTATAGSSSISFAGGFLAANAICSIAVDVIPVLAGQMDNVTSALTSTAGNGGKASASLQVQQNVLVKAFTDDPVAPGTMGTLQFTVTNFNRSDAMSGVAFTDDLDAALSGMAAVGLPQNDVCGAGSSLSGTSLVSLTGGTLGAGESCTFSVPFQVPASTSAGSYVNTTSSVSYTVGGVGQTGPPGSDTLQVVAYPLLTKTFTDDPVAAGGTATMEFTITNSDPTNAASAITFTDNLANMLAGTTINMLPASGFCGGGSTAIQYSPAPGEFGLLVQGASLPAGGSCTFDVVLNVPAGATAGTYTNTTAPITATVNATSVTGKSASDDLVVASAPLLRKNFIDDPVEAGNTGTLRFTLTANANATGSVTGIGFTDDLDATLSGLVSTGLPVDGFCGAGSTLTGTSVLTMSGGMLAPGETCTFDVVFQVPAAASPGSYTNTTSTVSAIELGLPVTGAAASDSLVVSRLQLTKTFVGDPVAAGSSVVLHFDLTNQSSLGDYTNIAFTDNLSSALAGLTATGLPLNDVCGVGSQITGTTTLVFTGGSVPAGSSCSFDVPLQVPAAASAGDYFNTTSAVAADFNANPQTLSPASDVLSIRDPLTLMKEFTDDPVAPGDTVTLQFTIYDNVAQPATGISFTDDLDAALSGLVAVGLPMNDVCGAGSVLSGTSVISLTGGNLPASGTCTFQLTLQVPASVPAGTSPVNTTSQISGTVGGNSFSGAAASDTLLLDFITFGKAFAGAIGAGGTVDLTFTIDNLDPSNPVSALSFTDDLGAMLSGAVAVGLPMSDACGAGSTLSGTSVLTLTGGSLAAGGTCTITVPVQIPAAAALGPYTNTSSELQSAGLHVAAPATAVLTIEPPPLFSKSFAPASILPGQPSTLTFTIDDSAATNAAGALDFSDALPAGLTVATPANASTTCTGGTLTAASGSGSVNYAGGSVAAGSSCTVQVDVTASAAGSYTNVSGPLTSSFGSSGTATASLLVSEVTFAKSFVPGLAHAGDTIQMSFTLTNLDPGNAVANLSFGDDLNAMLTGAVVAGLPMNDVCGVGSTLSGTSNVTLTGGSLAAGGSCIITVPVQVPAAAALGTYTNTTSDLLRSGVHLANPASANLIVALVPAFTKTFAPAVIPSGQVSTLTFTIDNSASGIAADNLEFSDSLPAGMVIASPANAATTCTGGTLTATAGSGSVSYSGGSVAAAATCTVQTDVTASGAGTFSNTSGALTSSLGSSGTATADLIVSQVTFTKSFSPTAVHPGDTVQLSFTLTNLDPTNAVSDLSFSDDLDAMIPGLVATGLPQSDVCGAGSQLSGTSVVTLTGGTLPAGGLCTFALNLVVPAGTADGTYVNHTSSLTFRAGGSPVDAGPASVAAANLQVSTAVIGIPALSTHMLLLLGLLMSMAALLVVNFRK